MPNFEYNFNDNDYALVASSNSTDTFGSVETSLSSSADYIRLTIYNSAGIPHILDNGDTAIFYATTGSSEPFTIQTPGSVEDIIDVELGPDLSDFQIYTDPSYNLYIKPNEILSSSLIPEGNYKIQSDYLRQLKTHDNKRFIIKQISPSRKEVRLKLLNDNIVEGDIFINHFKINFKFNFHFIH